MKSIRKPEDLERILTCLQYLPEEDFQSEWDKIYSQLSNKGISGRRLIINNCLDGERFVTRERLEKDAGVLSWSIRRKLRRQLKNTMPKEKDGQKYEELLSQLKRAFRIDEEGSGFGAWDVPE